MLKSRDALGDVVFNLRSRRPVGLLADAIGRYKRVCATSSMLVVVLSLLLLGFVLDGSDRAAAGVSDAAGAVWPDTLDADTTMTRQSDVLLDTLSGDVLNELPEGRASYYGNELAGRPTANGEPFDPEGLTAAHPTLPFGTRLRVTSIRTGQSVIVRINDRGPFTGNRVLDLSYSAARKIGMLRRGTARVRMEVLK